MSIHLHAYSHRNIRIHMDIWMHTWTHIHIWMHTHIYSWAHACTYKHTHIHIWMSTHVHRWNGSQILHVEQSSPRSHLHLPSLHLHQRDIFCPYFLSLFLSTLLSHLSLLVSIPVFLSKSSLCLPPPLHSLAPPHHSPWVESTPASCSLISTWILCHTHPHVHTHT